MVIKMEGQPFICKTDEVGEICVHSSATGNQYWGLQGLTNNTFKVSPLQADGSPLGDVEYTRSGLLGFLGPGGLVFVCGSRDGLMTVTGRKHNADDIIATVLAVEPMKFIYRGRIAVFSVRVLRDERICVVAEQRPDCSEEEVRWSRFVVLVSTEILGTRFITILSVAGCSREICFLRASSGCRESSRQWTRFTLSGYTAWRWSRRITFRKHRWAVFICRKRSDVS